MSIPSPRPINVVPLVPRLGARSDEPSPAGGAPFGERTDDELVALARMGRRDAFAALAERHTARLVQLCAKMTGDRASAEEIAQDVWFSIWEHRAEYVQRGKFIVLLITAARNRCRNHARDKARRGRWVTSDDDARIQTASTDPSSIDQLLARERQERILAALSTVPEKLREALVLRFSEDLSYDQIADVVGANESTVRSRVHHALKNLRSHLCDDVSPAPSEVR